MPDLIVAAIQMDAQVGAVEANLARATELVEEAAAQGAQLIVLPELFAAGYEYTDRNFDLPEPLDGPTGTWIVETARRLGVHLVGSFPARMVTGVPDTDRMPAEGYIVALLAAPDGQRWIYRKIHVAMWENCYFERGNKPVIADTALGRIGLIICWDEIFADLARAYQGRVDLLCIPSSPPTYTGTLEDSDGNVLAKVDEMRALGRTLDGVDWFRRAQIAHARSAGVPLVYAARCGTFHSPFPYGASFLTVIKPRDALRVLRAAGGGYLLRCPMQGHSCILDARGESLAGAEQDDEAVLVATVQPGAPGSGAPEARSLPPVPRGTALIPGIPRVQLWFDKWMVSLGRRYRERHRQQTKENLENISDQEDQR